MTNQKTPDYLLIQKLRADSSEAFEELVRTSSRRLYNVSLRIVGNVQDAEDAVQETFLKVVRSIGSFDSQSSLYTWLYRIVYNQSLMKLRRRRGKKTLPIEAYLEHLNGNRFVGQIADSKDSPDHNLDSKELRRVLDQTIAELPNRYRIPYILKDFEKLSKSQVSKIMGISRSAVKNRVHRARLKIRERVANHLNTD